MTTKPPNSAFVKMADHMMMAAVDLFDAYGMKLERAPTDGPWPAEPRERRVAAVIGYGSANVRGALVLVASVESVQTWQGALAELDPSEDAIRDTIGEFANMVLGRMKNLLLANGIVLLPATPTTIFGIELTLPKSSAGTSRWYQFDGTPGRLGVPLDAEFDEGFVFRDDARQEAASEGEMLLF
jgi:hypothetical protein